MEILRTWEIGLRASRFSNHIKMNVQGVVFLNLTHIYSSIPPLHVLHGLLHHLD